ncbi:Smr/MutS family protein [Robiginitomaculum antarcticum]|uniref:Smr/MutS family protein n=1 Tax=Robiginitomaculum antarcticum TaxID=437507 RepID=UPI00035CA333|nr:Smr/MutS family protein [Robiginitomaculum antarcticum]
MAKRKTPLTSEDAQIWRRVAKTVRLAPDKILPDVADLPGGDVNPSGQTKLPSKRKPKIRAPYTAPQAYVAPSLKPLDQALDRKTRRGKISVDMKIDLHDLTQDEALAALVQGLGRARARRAKCVLVVTGKGSVTSGGVLRRRLPEWLARADIRPMIARYAPAHIRHGGSGAWYVYLKSNAAQR